jgi:hypothetical protein
LIVTDGLHNSQRTYHESPSSFFLVHHYFKSMGVVNYDL